MTEESYLFWTIRWMEEALLPHPIALPYPLVE
jgi:hypothetical protein